MSALKLILGIHLHQPVGNFESILEESYRSAYKPFIDLFEKFPSLSLVWHCSGFLLEWLIREHPDYIEKIGTLVERGRVEVLGGGMYEPIFTAIPFKDGLEQIVRLSALIKRHLRCQPKGAWLAERVWESGMIPILEQVGIEYVALDDYHFICSGFSYDQLDGYFVAGDIAGKVGIFPISEKLRYLIPWKRVDEVSPVFEEWNKKSKRLAVMIDDAEKFGHWPGTHKWVYDEGWLESFFAFLEDNQDIVETETFEVYFSKFPPLGRAALPDSSYQEMGQWALPPEMALKQEDLIKKLQMENLWDSARPFIRGGVWKNFLVRYPEANYMHKRMIHMSNKIREAGEEKSPAYEYVLKAQCNDAYWHGAFGGLYLPHLRHEIYRNILKAQNELDKITVSETSEKSVVSMYDIDMDRHEEILIDHPVFFCCISPFCGGAIQELSYKRKEFNLLSTVARWQEKYHMESFAHGAVLIGGESEKQHDIKNESFSFDTYPRYSVRESFFSELPVSEQLIDNEGLLVCSFANKPYAVNKSSQEEITLLLSNDSVMVTKRYIPIPAIGKIDIEFQITLKNPVIKWVGVDCNLGITGAQDPAKFLYSLNQKDNKRSLMGLYDLDRINGLCVEDERNGYVFSIIPEQYFWIRIFPIETVSRAVDRVEKTFQGLSIWSFLPLSDGENVFRISFVMDEVSV